MYNFKNSKKDLISILQSKTEIEKKKTIPKDENEFTFENGVRAWVGAIFIDIVGSKKLFEDSEEKVARIIRAFTQETIKILEEDENYRQIGIRGDCVYGIFNSPYKKDLVNLFRLAYKLNTFMKMFNTILKQNNFKEIKAGIGLGCGNDLVIKAGDLDVV